MRETRTTSRLRDFELPERAASYAGYGWALLPVIPGGKKPFLDLLRELYGDTRVDHLRDAPALVEEVEYWFNNEPSMNLGVLPGDGLVVIDIDDLSRIDPNLATPTAVSGRGGGGKHLYFRSEQHVGRRGFDWGHVNPAHAVLAGSLHETGRRYEWMEGRAPDEVSLMDFAEVESLFMDAR